MLTPISTLPNKLTIKKENYHKRMTQPRFCLMKEADKCNLKSNHFYRVTQFRWKSAGTMIWRLLVLAHYTPLFFFKQCSLVGIRIYRWIPTIGMTEA